MERIILAYCHENVGLANQIDEKLRRSGIRFEHVSDAQDKLPGQFVASVQATNAPVLLLITDNFLRRAECMSYAQPMLQQLLRSNRVLPIVADGFRLNPETGRTERVETHFERVIHAIIYMNYWQSVYLELRQKKDHAPPEDLENMDRDLRTVREISVEIGDFLNTLRNADYLTWDNFSANQFELFFRKFGQTELYQKYRQIAAADPVFNQIEEDFEESRPEIELQALPQNVVQSIDNEQVTNQFEVENSTLDLPIEPVNIEIEKVTDPENSTDFEIKEPTNPPDFWNKQAGPPPAFLPEESPFLGENLDTEAPIFEPPGFDILTHLDQEFDENSALEAAKTRKRRLSSESEAAKNEGEQSAKKTRSKKKENSNGVHQPAEEFGMLVKTGLETTSDFDQKQPESEPVEIELTRKLIPIPESPTREEIEALVAEIVREEASRAESRGAFSEKTSMETDQNEPVYGSETGLPPGFQAEEMTSVESTEEPVSRPVSAMQLPHFQPVSASADANDDIRITQTDAYFWLKKGDFEEARMQAEELTIKYPARAEGWFLMGEISEATGDLLAARHFWEKAILIDDEFPEAHLRLAKMLDQRFKTEKKEAVRHYRAAAKNDPTDSASLYRAGVISLENLGKHEKARRFFQKTVEREPTHAAAWYDLAHLEQYLGNFSEAAEAYERATTLDPTLKTETESRLFAKKVLLKPGNVFEKKEAVATEIFAENQDLTRPEYLQKETQLIDNQSIQVEIEPGFSEKKRILTVLITGATSGIGRATAEVFAKNGHRVIITGRRAERLAELENDFLANYKNEVLTACFDIRDRKLVEQMVDNLPENWREIDLLINNAGLAKGLDPFHESDFGHWEQMIDTNLKGLLYMSRLIAPGMVARQRGHIINIGSIAGKEVYPKGGVYNATKFAVDALTRAMRLDLVPHGVKVSSVSPGHVEETEFALVRFDGNAEKARIYDDFQPLSSQDVADTIYFIATRPAHVAIHDIVLTGAQQASATQVDRSGRG